MDDLENMMHNKSLKKLQFHGALLEYFNHTGEAKLPAIWWVFIFNNSITFLLC